MAITIELEKTLKEKTAVLLNCFGYVNANAEHIRLVEFSSTNGIYDYILANFGGQLIQFNYNDNGETKSWNLLIRNN